MGATPPSLFDPALPRPSRRRLIAFWVVTALFMLLLLGPLFAERPWYLLVPATVWGGWGPAGDFPSHTVHMTLVSLIHWVAIAGVVAQLHRPERQIGGAWMYGAAGVVTLAAMIGLGAVPAEMLPVLVAVMVSAGAAFVLHPSPLAAKVRPITRPSLVIGGIVAVAAIPMVVSSVDSFGVHLASGAGDEHFEFGHWAFMGVYPIVTLLLGGVAAAKISGWRLPGWTAAVLVLAHATTSLAVPSASALSTPWAVAALIWAVALVVAVEAEARRRPALAPSARVEPAVG
jgi:hypothetical protein